MDLFHLQQSRQMETVEGHRVETQHTHTPQIGEEQKEAGTAEQQGNGGY